VSGWANVPDRSGPADCVLITACVPGGVPRPWTILPDDLDSPDVAEATKNERMARTAFRMALPMTGLPKGKLIFAAWAVDEKQSAVRPLARTFAVEHR